ncbi:MAG: hypothetical protein ACYCYO_01820 [Bacilli bacterium]
MKRYEWLVKALVYLVTFAVLAAIVQWGYLDLARFPPILSVIGFLLLWTAVWFALEKWSARSRTQAKEAIHEWTSNMNAREQAEEKIRETRGSLLGTVGILAIYVLILEYSPTFVSMYHWPEWIFIAPLAILFTILGVNMSRFSRAHRLNDEVRRRS